MDYYNPVGFLGGGVGGLVFILGRKEDGEVGERKRETSIGRSVASCMAPNWASNPQPRYVP